MNNSPFISICIPAYKHVEYLQRLLDSLLTQTYRDYEIVITDDSPDDSVAELIEKYQSKKEIRYYKNAQPLGTPENWNEAIRKANGEWIKIMHNDDWFASDNALQVFYQNIQQHPSAVFFFSAFQNVEADTGKKQMVKLSYTDKKFFESNPYHLLKKVYVGNPSCTIVRKDLDIWYDKRYKFIVDFDYYIRVIQQTKMPVYIDEVLLNIGFHSGQVTGYTKYNPSVQLPENITFLNEQKKDILKDILVFDYYWRLMRNLKIDSKEKLMSFLGDIQPNQKILFIINFQKKIPVALLKIGFISKGFMLMAFAKNRLY
ncbi:MAG: glycosyltransferase family 2 protein [Bacteroidota bacterium]|nr:glycosyltransferase family 2 protein [Bacteroidota bacterium]